MRKQTWTLEEKQNYLVNQLKHYYKDLETLAGLKFEGLYNLSLDCNSKYTLDVILTATDNSSYISYDLGLTLYKKENGIAQHSLRLALDNPKDNLFEPIYIGYSTPCFRGKLKTDQTVGFTRSYVEPKELLRFFAEDITKEEEALSAYFDGATSLTDFMNKVLTKAKYPHLKVEGLEDD